MHLTLLIAALLTLPAATGLAQTTNPRPAANFTPGSATVLRGQPSLITTGADAMRVGRYDEGISLTLEGLKDPAVSIRNRAVGLANLCAAHAEKSEADLAIEYCNESIELYDRNWRAFNNRAYAYFLKGLLNEALANLDAAAAINPDAPEVGQIRRMVESAAIPDPALSD